MSKDTLGPVDFRKTGGEVVPMSGAELYDIWRVKIQMRGRLYGGVPKSAALIEAWNKERIKKAIKAGHDIKPEVAEAELKELMETLNVDEEAKWCGFKEIYRGANIGPYLDGYNIKAMLREAASQTGAMLLRFSNNRGFRQHYQHGIHVKDVAGLSDAIPVGSLAGQEEFVGHVKTPQGQKSVLSRFDYTEGSILEFQVWSLAVGILNTDLLVSLLLAAQEGGLGASRSRELSKFDVLEIERLQIGRIAHYESVKAKAEAKAEKDAAPKKRGTKSQEHE